MREEFLGELSVFDNNIPDLFNNYYRLKCPNKVEAEEIIERTCSFAGTETNPTGLKTLVSDLARIEKGEPVVAEPSNGNGLSETFVQRDIVAPPYLQIACQRLWNVRYPSKDGNADKPAVEHDKQATANGQFLSDYQTGFARTMLRQFCREKFLSLSFRERALLADAFDFLVTKNGAKIAYELDSLASHMQVHQNILKSVLLKLSRSDSRILRMSKGPDGSLWFELYHDMYGSIVDEWKRSYRMERRAALQRNLMLAGMLLGIILVIAGAIVSFHHWYSEPQHYQKLLATADLQDSNKYPENLSAYIKLRETLGYRSRARKLWAEAWERRAHQAERQENESESFLFWLTAASEAPPKERAQSLAEVSNYLDSGDFKSLQATIRFEGAFSAIGINPPIFSDNGQALLKITSDLRIWKWNTNSGVLLTTSPPLQLDDQRSPRRPDSGPEVTTQSREPFIRAAAGNFVGGFDSNKFYVWTIDKGTIVWSAWRTGQPAASAPTAQPVTGGKKVFYGGGNYGTRTVEPSVAFSPDGQYFATVDDAGSTQTYTLGNKQRQPCVAAARGA